MNDYEYIFKKRKIINFIIHLCGCRKKKNTCNRFNFFFYGSVFLVFFFSGFLGLIGFSVFLLTPNFSIKIRKDNIIYRWMLSFIYIYIYYLFSCFFKTKQDILIGLSRDRQLWVFIFLFFSIINLKTTLYIWYES
jgi:hypothetical protein